AIGDRADSGRRRVSCPPRSRQSESGQDQSADEQPRGQSVLPRHRFGPFSGRPVDIPPAATLASSFKKSTTRMLPEYKKCQRPIRKQFSARRLPRERLLQILLAKGRPAMEETKDSTLDWPPEESPGEEGEITHPIRIICSQTRVPRNPRVSKLKTMDESAPRTPDWTEIGDPAE